MYGITVVNSKGFSDGRESITFVGTEIVSLATKVWQDYITAFKWLSKEDRLDSDGNSYTKSKFISEIMRNNVVVIQAVDFHINYEPFEF